MCAKKCALITSASVVVAITTAALFLRSISNLTTSMTLPVDLPRRIGAPPTSISDGRDRGITRRGSDD